MTIAAGGVSTNIVVTPLGGNLTTNQVTVTVNLNPSALYSLTSLSNASIGITDHPINTWLRNTFTPVELGNPLISGDNADPDNDGIPNLVEYAMGLPPKIPNQNGIPAFVSNGFFDFSYSVSKSAMDVAIIVQWSPDLKTWNSGTNYIQTNSILDQVTNQSVGVQAISPVITNSSGYFRFSAKRL